MALRQTSATPAHARPFLKWAGGKQWLAPRLVPCLDGQSGTYYEPFLGGGALYFALNPANAYLSDTNSELVACYRAIRSNVRRVIDGLEALKYDKPTFTRIRRARPTTDVERAVRLIYLNKTAFNGIYRENRSGEFNVPFGAYKNPTICQRDRLKRASSALANARLRVTDFRDALALPQRGDLVYLDPPYVTGHNNNGFIKYNRRLFAWDDQEALADVAEVLRRRGVRVIISNASHDSLVNLYPKFEVYELARNSLVGGGKNLRGRIDEILLSSHPLDLDLLQGYEDG